MNTTQAEQKYRIGTVARLTGISPDTLRIWERRYRVVQWLTAVMPSAVSPGWTPKCS